MPNLIQRLAALRGAFELQIVSDEAKRGERVCKRAAALPSARGWRWGFLALAAFSAAPLLRGTEPPILPRHRRSSHRSDSALSLQSRLGGLGLLINKLREKSYSCSKII